MIDASKFTRRFLRQFGLILVWQIIFILANPTSVNSTIVNVILALIGVTLLVGIIPGSYFSGLIHKISTRAENTSLNALIFIALLTPLLFAVMYGLWAYDNFEMLNSSLPQEAIRELDIHYRFGLNLIGFILPTCLLISNIVLLFKRKAGAMVDS